MKIMHLLFSFTIGGTERLVSDICNEMVAKEHDVHLYIVNDLLSKELLATLNEKVHVCLQKRQPGGEKLSVLWKIAQYVKKEQIEVIHCHSFDSPELLLLSKIMNPKVRIVQTIHGMGQYGELNKIKLIVRNCLCDAFIGISECVKQDIVLAGAPACKTHMIYNGIKSEKYSKAIYKIFDKEHVKVGCVARIMPSVKGQDILIKAVPIIVKKYSEIKVEFAGGIAKEEAAEYEKLQSYTAENGIQKNVDFLGSVSDVPSFLNTIDILVVPSRTEGFGLALVEAMAMGVPCIASDIEGPAEIVNNEKIGILFKSEDEKSLSEYIIKMIENYELYKKAAWNKRKYVLNKYGIETMCEKLTLLYAEL